MKGEAGEDEATMNASLSHYLYNTKFPYSYTKPATMPQYYPTELLVKRQYILPVRLSR